MPTVLRGDGLRVVMYVNDHPPAHVRVWGAGREAVFDLQYPDGPPCPRENHGFGAHALRRIERALNRELSALCERWRMIHGDFR